MPAPHPILFARLRLAQYGPDIAMPDLRHELARCPHSHNMRQSLPYDQCGARCPDLSKVV